MNERQNRIDRLISRLANIEREQEKFRWEIEAIKKELNFLKSTEKDEQKVVADAIPKVEKTISTNYFEEKEQNQPTSVQEHTPIAKKTNNSSISSGFEKFIGENLISKIGIAITVIGVAIGANYAIEHQLISPLSRIVLAYLVGLGLLGVAIKLKKKYENFSSVLLSGAMAIMYFITYAAYSFYDLIPQTIAFILLVFFTVFTVLASIKYNNVFIAIFGLVGAYAVPFLLSDGSGNVLILFTYVTIINLGILFVSFRKDWKLLYYVSFGFSWIIFISWFGTKYNVNEHSVISLSFLTIFFLTFYTIFIANQLIKKELFKKVDLLMLLLNSTLFYGLGIAILNSHIYGNELLGVFTLINAVIHFAVGLIVYKFKIINKNLIYTILATVLVFVSITIPIELDANWVTLLWAAEAALLFYLGRSKKIAVFEIFSYPLILIAVFSLIQDWSSYQLVNFQTNNDFLKPIFNINFLSSILLISILVFINKLINMYESAIQTSFFLGISKWIKTSLAILLIGVIYLAFYVEITHYFHLDYIKSSVYLQNENAVSIANGFNQAHYNYNLMSLKNVWISIYSLLFTSALIWWNNHKIKSKILTYGSSILAVFFLIIYLTSTLYTLGVLRDNYDDVSLNSIFYISPFNLYFRYITYVFVAILIKNIHQSKQQFLNSKFFRNAFDLMLHISIIWVASSELINLLELAGSSQSYKLGLSILWALYSLILVAYGIWKGKKHIRIGSIAFFGITLLKLFFYDISQLDTISKTIVFVSLGFILLIISFLYNKYKHLINNDKED